jgi:outer membrane protein
VRIPTVINFKSAACAALVVAGSVLAQSARAQIPVDNARPITLSEAVRLARHNAPAAIQARGNERTSRAAVRSAYGAFIPNVSVNLGTTHTYSANPTTIFNPATGERLSGAQTYSSGLSANVTLFDGGRNFYNLRTARASVTSAEAGQIASDYAVALDVSQQYFNALAAREMYTAAQTQLQEAQQQQSVAVKRVRAGVATKSDSLRTLIEVGNAQLAILQAQADLRAANATLTRLVGLEETVTAATVDTVNALVDSVALDTTRLAVLAAQGPAVRESQANYAAARTARRAARAPYLPTISASYSRNGSGIDPQFGFASSPYTYNGRLGFSLSYPLFNGFVREENVVRADVAEDVASAELRDAQLLAQQSLVQYVDALRTGQARVAVQLVSVTAALEDLRVQQQRYQAGASTLLDVITSQRSLRDAQAALIQARFDARVARARLESLIGQSLTGASLP